MSWVKSSRALKKAFLAFFNYGLPEMNSRQTFQIAWLTACAIWRHLPVPLRSMFFQHASAPTMTVFFLAAVLWIFPSALPGRETGVDGSTEAEQKVPFTIERADHFFQRADSTGAERFILKGNVVITRVESRIRCGVLTYFPDSRHFLCLDSVALTDPDREVNSDTLLYYIDTAHYHALGNLRWSTSSGIAGSGRQGDYYRSRNLMVIEGEAVAEDSLRRIEAEKLEHDDISSRLKATGGIILTHKKSRSKATAASGLYDRDTGITTLTGRPLLKFYDKTDTLELRPFHLSCDHLLSYGADSMVAVGRVRLWDDSLTITSDSLFHDAAGGRSYFRGGAPQIDNPGYNMRGAQIDIHTRDRQLEQVVAVRDARGEFYQHDTAPADSAPGADNWIEGDTLNVAFGAEGLDSIVASGGARSYFRENPQAALNYVIGSRIILVWQEGLIDRVEVTGGGRGLHLLPDTLDQIFANPDSASIDTLEGNEK